MKLVSLQEDDGYRDVGHGQTSYNAVMFSPWTIVHVLTGIASGAAGVPYMWGFVLHTLYELCNRDVNAVAAWRRVSKYGSFQGDSDINTVGDTIAFMLGMYIAKKWSRGVFPNTPLVATALALAAVFVYQDLASP